MQNNSRQTSRSTNPIENSASLQTNKIFQVLGAASDLYDDTDAITLYMLAGTDYVRMVKEFESVHKLLSESTGHHEEARTL